MFDEPEVLRIVAGWVQKAENDLTNAAHALKLGKACPTDTVCFHAQQCVEKYLKALLVWRGIDFHKTHSVPTLVAQLAQRDRPDLADAEQELLTRYATVTRYPGNYDSIPLKEARQAVKIARRVRRQIRKLLPR